MNNEQLLKVYKDSYVKKEAAASDFGSISGLFDTTSNVFTDKSSIFPDVSKTLKVDNPILKVPELKTLKTDNSVFKTEPIIDIYKNARNAKKGGSSIMSKLKGIKPKNIGKVGLIGGGIGLIAALIVSKSRS